jgi:general secretion pathway protein K
MSREATGQRSERGLALVSVLWGVSILSLIAATMLTAAVSTTFVDRNVWNATRGGAADDAVVNLAVLELMDDRGDRQPRVDGTARPLVFAGIPVTLWIQDEGGKININFADRDLLAALFASQGAGRDQAGTLADRILDRRKAASARGGPATVAFRDTDELIALGVPRDLYVKIRPAITVYGRNAGVNQDVAPREALLAMPNMDAQTVSDMIRRRNEARLAMPPGGGPVANAGTAFAITVEARVNGALVVREAVVQFTGDERRPYWFLSWK